MIKGMKTSPFSAHPAHIITKCRIGKIFIFAYFILISGWGTAVFAQKNNTFQHSYGGANDDFSGSVLILPDKGYILTGFTQSFGAGMHDLIVIRTDSLGRKIWSKTYGGNMDEGNIAFYVYPSLDVLLSPDNCIVICSNTESYGKGGKDVYVLKLDLQGNVKWDRTYGGSSDDIGYGIINDPSGGYVLVGETQSYGAGNGDVLVMKLNDTGGVVWSKAYGNASNEEAGYRIIPSRDGNYLICGYAYSSSTSYDHLIMKVTKNGALIWSKVYGQSNYDASNDIMELPDRSIIVDGFTYNIPLGENTQIMEKLDSSGNLKWSKIYSIGALRSMVYDSTKKIINCVGMGDLFSYPQRIFFAQFDTSGGFKALNSFGPTTYSSTDGYTMGEGHMMLSLKNKGFIGLFSESIYGRGGSDIFLVKMDSNGKTNSCNTLTTTLSPSNYSFPNNSYTFSTNSITMGMSQGVQVANANISDSATCQPFVCNYGYTTNCSNLDVNFSDSSYYYPISWNWNFGEASSSSNTSTSQNPVHTYAKGGTYNVKLTVSDGTLTDTMVKTIVIYSLPVASFTDSIKCLQDSVNFINTSQNGVSYLWHFGDGDSSVIVNPKHKYTSAGNYSVTILEKGHKCTSSFTGTISVVNAPKPVFTLSDTVVCIGTKVNEAGKTLNNIANPQWWWDFGEGLGFNKTIDSNASHNFIKPGTFTVTLKVFEQGNTCFATYSKNIDVLGFSRPFIVSSTATCAGDSINLSGKDSANNTNSWLWDFGDGDTSGSHNQNVAHIYKSGGSYPVKLQANNGACAPNNTTTKIVIGNNTKPIISALKLICISDSLHITGNDSNGGNGLKYTWDFGDKSGDTIQSPIHKYTTAGNYRIKLTLKKASCISSNTDSINVFIDSSCVWPGDADFSKEVDINDLLPIGVGYSASGSKRPNASINWTAQPAYNWSNAFATGHNYKVADCNGDGTIDSLDIPAITSNYGKTHTKTSEAASGSANDPALSINLVSDSAMAGDTIVAVVSLGTSANPVSNIYGLTFGVSYSGELSGVSYFKTDLSKDWLGTLHNDLISLEINDTTNRIVYVGQSRTNHKNVSGDGQIAALTFIVPANISGKREVKKMIHFNIVEYKAISANEKIISLNPVGDSVVAYEYKSGLPTDKLESFPLHIYPNPANNVLYIKSDNHHIRYIEIKDMFGKVVYSLASSSNISGIAIDALSKGMYVIDVTTDAGIARSKFVKE